MINNIGMLIPIYLSVLRVSTFCPYRFLDNEDQKNSICMPVDAPHDPVLWFDLRYKVNLNLERLGYTLGIGWIRTKRLSLISHLGFIPSIKILFSMLWNKDQLNEKMKLFGTQYDVYGKFDSTTLD